MTLCEVQVNYKPQRANRPKINSAEDIFALKDLVFNMDTISYQEQFVILLLNHGDRVLGHSTISTGGQAATHVDVKMVAQRAILTHASSVVLMHNHPSGELKPSPQDDALTRKIVEALKLFDIRVLDHLIVSDNDKFYSYNSYGKI